MTFDYGEELRETIRRRLSAHDVREHPLDGRRHAAVAIVLVESDAERHGHDSWADGNGPIDMSACPGDVTGLDGRIDGAAGGAAFLLCRRAARMNRHAGQFALPGGRIDAPESAEEAARREVQEELGITIGSDQLLGRLDDYSSRSGYVISPFVYWLGGEGELDEDPGEVACTYRIALTELCRPDSPRFESIPESDRPVLQLRFGNDLIHPPTAAPLLQFRWVALEGRSGDEARVDHFEQPVFAWK
jgi:8-oxo-dGTP pyrophosphatase MutT (NUDIX family)